MRSTTTTTATPSGSSLRGLAVGIALLVTATACANGDDNGPGATADGTPAAAAVSARNINFEPADLQISVGTIVTFTNEDIVRHTVTAGSPDGIGDAFDEELDSEGDTITITFDEPGAIDYFCRLHPTMTGTIDVS